MALTKKDANAKYDKLRKQLKSGEISQERFKQAADRIYKMYHSDANKGTRNAKPAIKAKPASKTKAAPETKTAPKAKAAPTKTKKTQTAKPYSARAYAPGVMYGEDVSPGTRTHRGGERARVKKLQLAANRRKLQRKVNKRGRRIRRSTR
tara:strand:- start:271 stop:720 length:450 start_codon:yes stop_codon:yes gene_type:complete